MASVLATYAALQLERYRLEFTTTACLHTRFKSIEHIPGALIALLGAARRPAPRPVVHVHLSSGGSLVREGGLLRAARRLGLPTVASMHASGLDEEVRDRARRLHRVLSAAHVVHALGEATAGRLRAVMGPAAEIAVLPNCVPLPAHVTPAGDQPPRVLFAGEVSTRKGVDVLLAAWPHVRAAVPDAELLVFGVRDDVAVSPPDGARYLGSVRRERVLAELGTCRVAVLPTRAEVQPVFVLEAMAAGRPVVTTPVAEIPATIGEGGTLVGVGDAQALAGALTRFLTDRAAATTTGRLGRERAERVYSPARVGRDLERIYDRATALAGAAAPRTDGAQARRVAT